MSPEMESMHHFCTPNKGVDASVASSWSVNFAQFVPAALLHSRKKAGRKQTGRAPHVPEIGLWIAAKNPVTACLIIQKQSYENNSFQSDEPAVQEASLSIVIDGILHCRSHGALLFVVAEFSSAATCLLLITKYFLEQELKKLPNREANIVKAQKRGLIQFRDLCLHLHCQERTCFKLALRFADSAEFEDCFASIKEALADEEDQGCRHAVALVDSNLQAALDPPPLAYTFPIENSQPSDTVHTAQCTLIPASHSKSQQVVHQHPDTQVSGSLKKRGKRSLSPSLLPGSSFQELLLQGISEPVVHFPRHHRVVASAANAQAPQEYTVGISELNQDVCLSEVMHLQVPKDNESYMIGDVDCHKETNNLHKHKASSIEEHIDLQRTDESMRHTAVQPSQEFEGPLSSQGGPAGLSQSIDFRRQLLDCILDPSFRKLVKEVENILLELERSSHTDVIAKLLET